MRLRFFMFVLLAAAFPPVAALLVTTQSSAANEAAFEQRITSASMALQANIDSDDQKRRTVLLQLSLLWGVTNPIHTAGEAKQPPPASVIAAMREAIRSSPLSHEVPELIAAVTAAGSIVSVTNGDPKPVAIADLPLAATGLTGQTAEIFAKYDGFLYRFTASPVGIPDGAIVLGFRVGESSALRWRENVRADVTLVGGGGGVGVSTLKEEMRKEVTPSVMHPNETLLTGHLEGRLGQLSFFNSLLPIMVHQREARRSLARNVGGVFAIVTLPSDLGWVVDAQALGFVFMLVVLVIGAAWSQVIYGPIHRQARSIEAHLARLRVQRETRLGTKGFTSPFREVSELLDKLAETWTLQDSLSRPTPMPREINTDHSESPRPAPVARPSAPLPLGGTSAPASGEPESPPSFGFREDEAVTGRHSRTTGKQKTGANAAPAPPPVQIRPSAPIPAPSVTFTDMKRATAAPTSATLPARNTASTVKPVDASKRDSFNKSKPPELSAALGQAGRISQNKGIKASDLASQTNVSKVNAARDLKGPATHPAMAKPGMDSIPPELLAASDALEAELMGGGGDASDDDYFNSIYEEFMETRRRCGEPSEGVGFEKFTSRLKANRDQLKERYGCEKVQFQVYVKDGKAAVKAQPVK